MSDPFLPMAESYALGVLETPERMSFDDHLAGCTDCRRAVAAAADLVAGVASTLPFLPPPPQLREQLLDLAEAPRWPFDLEALAWQEIGPSIRLHVIEDDAGRGVRKCLVWASPGASNPRHRHGGDECILVLKGGLRDERGEYHAGELCRSRRGSIHSEVVLPGEDCVCYVVYYGPLEFL